MGDRNKYIYMEKDLQEINKKCVSLDDREIERTNKILHEILKKIIAEMSKDKFFKVLYMEFFFGGSYYDGIKVGQPEEFDLDLLFKLPVSTMPVLSMSNKPGFVNVQLTNLDKYLTLPEAEHCKNKLNKFIDDKKYLSTDNVLNWFKGLVDRTLNAFKNSNGNVIINVNSTDYYVSRKGAYRKKLRKNYYNRPRPMYNAHITKSSSGPAVTLKISANNFKIDVDLVPCFKFTNNDWPNGNYRKNATDKQNFLIVPKAPKETPNSEIAHKYWRLSFQEQERRIIADKRHLKPTLKLIKKLRDVQDHKLISSYFIKTIFLWEVDEREKQNDDAFWRAPLSYVFMTMLQKYAKYLEEKHIPYYWNKRYNLLPKDDKATALDNHAQRIKNIVAIIERNNGKSVKDFLLTPNERLSMLQLN